MSIPESQLETWAGQGSIQQSSATYQAIANVLNDPRAPYHGRDYSVFLQGSYGNHTNIYAESDVDIIIQLNESFFKDLSHLPPPDQGPYQAAAQPAHYGYAQFQNEVSAHLFGAFGNTASWGNKALKLAATNSRRAADIVIATTFRRYYRFQSLLDQDFEEGICFWTGDGVRIVNYPRQHADNCIAKQARTGSWFKPVVRIFKNLRSAMVADGYLAADIAPSYFIESMLHNVPDQLFGRSYADSVTASIAWLSKADASALLCANGQYYLLWEGGAVTWREAKFRAFLDAAARYWNDWYRI